MASHSSLYIIKGVLLAGQDTTTIWVCHKTYWQIRKRQRTVKTRASISWQPGMVWGWSDPEAGADMSWPVPVARHLPSPSFPCNYYTVQTHPAPLCTRDSNRLRKHAVPGSRLVGGERAAPMRLPLVAGGEGGGKGGQVLVGKLWYNWHSVKGQPCQDQGNSNLRKSTPHQCPPFRAKSMYGRIVPSASRHLQILRKVW